MKLFDNSGIKIFIKKLHRAKSITSEEMCSSYKSSRIAICMLFVSAILLLISLPFFEHFEKRDAAKNGHSDSNAEEAITTSASVPAKVFPLNGRITSEYGWRSDPFDNSGYAAAGYEFHSGIDISASESREVMAYTDGQVIKVGVSRSYGNYILISHGTHDSFYAHCASVNVKEGDYVSVGQVIATAGSTGRATGPHLHFEIRVHGTAIDPWEYIGEQYEQRQNKFGANE